MNKEFGHKDILNHLKALKINNFVHRKKVIHLIPQNTIHFKRQTNAAYNHFRIYTTNVYILFL